jgi:hypothetical protein
MLALVREPLGDDVAARRVTVQQRDPIPPAGVDLVELGQVLEAPRGPKPGLALLTISRLPTRPVNTRAPPSGALFSS